MRSDDPYDGGYRTCARCERYYTRHQSIAYCVKCLETHPAWAPTLGCGDLGCGLGHGDDS